MAYTLTLSFNNIINESVQVGDIVYFSPVTAVGTASNAFDSANVNNILRLGKVTAINNPNLYSGSTSSIVLLANLYYDNGTVRTPNANDFIMFGKDKTINTASLVGYYAEVNFVNDSDKEIELFSVGSEVAESSK